MSELIEQHEHATHAAGEGHRWTALLVAALAATLALCGQGAKHGEIAAQQSSIAAADLWGQYQAKSIRATMARDLHDIVGALPPGDAGARQAVLDRLASDAARYDRDPKDGKEAIATRARALEAARDGALEEAHAYHNASAMLELGIVLATASAIITSRLLIGLALALGVGGAVVGVLGLVAPAWGAF